MWILKLGDEVLEIAGKTIPKRWIVALEKGTAKLIRQTKAGKEFAASQKQIAKVINESQFSPKKLKEIAAKVTPKKPVKKAPAKKQDAPAAATETKASKAAKIRAERKTKRAADKKRAEEKAEKLRKQREATEKKRKAKERKAKEAAEKKAAREADEIQAGTRVPVKGAGKPHATREPTKPAGTETLFRKRAGAKDSTGKSIGGQRPPKGSAGAPGSKTRQAAKAAVEDRIDRRLLGGMFGALAAGAVTGALLSDKDEDKKKPAKTETPVRAGPLRPDPVSKKKEKEQATNAQLRKYYDDIEKIQAGAVTGETVTFDKKTYGGATGPAWQEFSRAWEKKYKKPEGLTISKLAKKAKEKVTSSKRGGGQVSRRPKSYQTAKIMKQYSKGGSVRKPNRI